MELMPAKIMDIFMLLLLIIKLSNGMAFSLDVSSPLALPCQVIQIYQLSNSSILIQYNNLTFVLYSNQLQYTSSFNLYTSKPQTNKFSLSQDERFLYSTQLDKQIQYSYDLMANKFFQGWTKTNALIYHQDYYSNLKVVVFVTNIYFSVFLSNNLMSGSYTTSFMTNITILRNSTAQFIDAVLIKSAMNYKAYCATNYQQILQFTATYSSSSNYTQTHQSLYNHTLNISSIFYLNGIVFFEDINLQIGGYDLNSSVVVNFPSDFTGQNLKSVAFLDSFYYFLMDQQLFKTSYNTANHTFTLIQINQTNLSIFITINKVNLTQNTGLNMLSYAYEPGSNLLYSFSRCTGNNAYDNISGTCLPYVCLITNCVICNFRNNICTQCNTTITPLVINNFYQCVYPLCNVFNCLYCYNTTACSICVQGFINQIGLCVVVNLTVVTNATNSTTLNTTNVTSNTTIKSNSTIDEFDLLLIKYDSLLQMTLSSHFYFFINSIPGSRRFLSQLLALFTNLDDIWLYNYHKKHYDSVMVNFFQLIQQLQTQKWNGISLINFQTEYLHINFKQMQSQLSFKYQYSQSKFIQVQTNSNGYMLNTLTFYCSNFIIIVGIFIGFKMLGLVFIHHFHQYCFWIYLFIIFIDGNLQYMTYLFAFQFTTLFYTQFFHKAYSIIIIIISFGLIFISLTVYSIIKYINHTKSKYLFDNCYINRNCILYLTAELGIRNITLGFIHFFIQTQNPIKILYLLFVQILFLTINFIVVRSQKNKLKIIKLKIKHWIGLINTFFRILLVLILVLNEDINQVHKATQLYSIFSITQLFILYVFLCLMICSIIYQVGTTISQVIKKYIKLYNMKIRIQCALKQQKRINLQKLLHNKIINLIYEPYKHKIHYKQKQFIRSSIRKSKIHYMTQSKRQQHNLINRISIQSSKMKCKATFNKKNMKIRQSQKENLKNIMHMKRIDKYDNQNKKHCFMPSIQQQSVVAQ